MARNSQISQSSSLEPFASPDYLDPQLQKVLEDACSLLCQWFAKAGQTGPLPLVTGLPEISPRMEGLSGEALMADIQLLMDGSYQPSHPGALAHLDPPPLTASIVGDLISAGLNNNLLAEELSPSLSRLERKLCKWFAEQLGMPLGSGGVAASGGTLSNLMALVVARQLSGLECDPSAVIFASADAHVSLAKAIRVMGLPCDALQRVCTNTQGQISLEDLEEQLKRLRSKGRKCFAVVATAGTTVRGAVDPLVELANLASREGLWLHIDAAIGGVFALSKTTSTLIRGISAADSVSVNPQKLLGITKTSSLLLMARKSDLKAVFSTGLPYIEPAWEEAHGGEMGIQGTRSAEVLKLWLGLRQLGKDGIKQLLDQSILRRNYLEQKIEPSKFNLLSGPLHLIAMTPKGLDDNAAAAWSVLTRKFLLEKKLMLSRPIHEGRYYLKAVTGNPHTSLELLERLAILLNNSVEITNQ